MPTLRFRRPEDMSASDREILERIAKLRETTIEGLSEIWKAQAHWPPLLEVNVRELFAAVLETSKLPMLTKQAMHVGVSMSNACDF